MNDFPITLLTLLDLLDGRLPPLQAERVRRRLREDAQLAQHWNELVATCQAAELASRLAPPPAVAPELLAGFVEERLAPGEQSQVEQACWQNRSLLQEVRALRRHVATPNGIPAAPQPLKERLASLWDSQTSADTALPQLPRRHPSRPAPVRMRAGRRAQRRQFRSVGVAIVASVAVLLLGLGWWLLRDQVMVETRPPQPTIAEDSAHEIAAPKTRAASPTTRSQSLAQAPVDHGDDASGDLPGYATGRAAEHFAPGESTSPPSSAPRPDPVVDRSRPSARPVEHVPLSWPRVRGVLAVLDRRLGRWFGAAAEAPHSHDAYLSLSASWGEAESEEWGQLAVAADTMVSVQSTAGMATEGTAAVHIVVHYGSIALRQLSPSYSVELEAGPATWLLRPLDDSTAIVLEWHGQIHRLQVVRGRVEFSGEIIERGEFVTFVQGYWSGPQKGAAANRWRALTASTAKIASSLQRSLLASTDLLADIRRLAADGSQKTREFAVRWSLALSPQTTLLEVLESGDRRLHHAAVSWLIAKGIHHRPVREAMRNLARQVGVPGTVRHLADVVDYLHRRGGQPLPLDLVNPLVISLRSPDPRLRVFGHTLLVIVFGERVPYNPSDPQPMRERAVQAWSRVIQRYYRSRTKRPAKRPQR